MERLKNHKAPGDLPATPTTTTNTFVLRFLHQITAGEARWWGTIEHVQSGEKVVFQDLETMLAFLQQFRIKVGDRDLGKPNKGE